MLVVVFSVRYRTFLCISRLVPYGHLKYVLKTYNFVCVLSSFSQALVDI